MWCFKWWFIGHFLLILSGNVFSSNILVLDGLASPSHHLWMRSLCLDLVARGHNVTAISTDVEANLPENFHYLHLDKIYEHLMSGTPIDLFDLGGASVFEQTEGLRQWYLKSVKGIKNSRGYKKLLDYPNDFSFDLILYDYAAGPVLLPFASKFVNSPVVAISAYSKLTELVPITGLPFFTSFAPNIYLQSTEMTFLNRVLNTLYTFFEYYDRNRRTVSEVENALRSDFPKLSIAKIEKRIKLSLINYHPAIDLPQPTSPDIISIGGFHIRDPKPIPEEFNKVIDSSSNGVVVFALGTNIKSEDLGLERLNKILKALGEIPEYTFLWKLDKQGLKLSIPKNVHVKKWLPQTDILAHPKTKLFISHCGMLSSLEAVWYGVPVLGIPVFLDQFTNAQNSVNWGMAERIHINDIDKAMFKETLLKMLSNSSYAERAAIRSRNFRDQPEKPVDKAMWWIEYVMRNPNIEFLKSKSLELNVFQRESIDVYLAIFVAFLGLCYLLKKIICGVNQVFFHRDKKFKTL